MQRALHTLKGGARMTGLFAMGDAAHELETRLAALEASGVIQAEALAPVGDAVAGLRQMSDRLERGDLSGLLQADEATPLIEIGRASCRESVCQLVLISVVGVSLNITTHLNIPHPYR